MHSFKITAGQNPLMASGELEDLAAGMRAIGLAVDDPMLYACFLDALRVANEVEVRQLTAKTDLGREIMRTIRERLMAYGLRVLPRAGKMERLTTVCSVVKAENTRVVAKGMVGTAPVGVAAAAEAAKTTGQRAGKMTIAQVQAERRTRNPLTGRGRNAGGV